MPTLNMVEPDYKGEVDILIQFDILLEQMILLLDIIKDQNICPSKPWLN